MKNQFHPATDALSDAITDIDNCMHTANVCHHSEVDHATKFRAHAAIDRAIGRVQNALIQIHFKNEELQKGLTWTPSHEEGL